MLWSVQYLSNVREVYWAAVAAEDHALGRRVIALSVRRSADLGV
jgi:hypothetical protein